jgi:hypothetical protein
VGQFSAGKVGQFWWEFTIVGASMYTIEKKSYGVKLTFSGVFDIEDMIKWNTELEKFTNGLPHKFGIFIDLRGFKSLSHETEVEMHKGLNMIKKRGVERSVVILNDVTLKLQFKRQSPETDNMQWERYIVSSSTANWEEISEKMLAHGINPDK